MNDFFNLYKQAFDNYDAQAIASHYKFPCQISDVDGLLTYETLELLTNNFFENCEHMRSLGYTSSAYDIIATKSLGENIASVDMSWQVSLNTGVYVFKTLYLCHRKQSKWLIFNAVVYE